MLHTLRLAILAVAALAMTGCVTLDGLGGQVTQAQAEYLRAQADMRDIESQERIAAVAYLAMIASGQRLDDGFGSVQTLAVTGQSDPVVRAWAMSSIERLMLPQNAAPRQTLAGQQDGPIIAGIKALAPYVLPVADVLLRRAQGKDQIKFQTRQLATSVEMEGMRLGLIDSIVGQISRDPLVVQTPPPQIIPAPEPIIITTPDPIIIGG